MFYGSYTTMNIAAGITVLYLVFCAVKVDAYFNDDINPLLFSDEVWHRRNTRVADNTTYSLMCERPDVYICEEPPDVVPPEHTKVCNYRNWRYHEQVFRWVAGRGCLQFTRPGLFVAGENPFNLNSGCYYGHLFAPCLEMAKEDGTCACYPFDPGLEEVARAVREALIPSVETRWERCFEVAKDCCSHVMLQNNTEPDSGYCEPTFDAWSCWDETPAGTVATQICSEFAYSNSGPTCHHFSSKTCFDNSTWNVQTDFSTCGISQRFTRRYNFHIAMLSLSIASCLPAVFVFFFYKRLRVDRVILHRNLLIAIIIRNIFVIVLRTVTNKKSKDEVVLYKRGEICEAASQCIVYLDELNSDDADNSVMSRNPMWCRVLSVFERTAGNTVFVCMLIEGIYLHRLIVAVFRKKINIYILYGIGAAIAIIPVTAWAVVMGVHENHSCWVIYTKENIQWILDVPRLCILIVNTGLFIDVLRVLLTKIRNSENVNQLSTTKATLFLMPIFGTQFLLTAIRPNTTNCTGEEAYYFITYTIEGLQGFIVAMLYCYVNKEVHTLVKATYKKTENAVVSRVRRESNYRRTTLGFSADRRMTFSTGLDSNHPEELGKDQYAVMKPKLHVAEIVSLPNSERLADILEPIYESVGDGIANEGYDSLRYGTTRFVGRGIDNYSKTSSVADPKDWIKCVSSPTSTVYNNSLNDYEVNYLQNKFPKHAWKRDISNEIESDFPNSTTEYEAITFDNKVTERGDNELVEEKIYESNYTDEQKTGMTQGPEITESGTEDASNKVVKLQGVTEDAEIDEDLYSEIMQYIENSNIVLDPNVLSPNRNDGDKIVFVD